METLYLSSNTISGSVAGKPLLARFRLFPAGSPIPRGQYHMSFAGENAIYGAMLAVARADGAGTPGLGAPLVARVFQSIEWFAPPNRPSNVWSVTSRRMGNAPGLVIDQGFVELVNAVRGAQGIRLMVT